MLTHTHGYQDMSVETHKLLFPVPKILNVMNPMSILYLHNSIVGILSTNICMVSLCACKQFLLTVPHVQTIA